MRWVIGPIALLAIAGLFIFAVIMFIYSFFFQIPEMKKQCENASGRYELTRDGLTCWHPDGRRMFWDEVTERQTK